MTDVEFIDRVVRIAAALGRAIGTLEGIDACHDLRQAIHTEPYAEARGALLDIMADRFEEGGANE